MRLITFILAALVAAALATGCTNPGFDTNQPNPPAANCVMPSTPPVRQLVDLAKLPQACLTAANPPGQWISPANLRQTKVVTGSAGYQVREVYLDLSAPATPRRDASHTVKVTHWQGQYEWLVQTDCAGVIAGLKPLASRMMPGWTIVTPTGTSYALDCPGASPGPQAAPQRGPYRKVRS